MNKDKEYKIYWHDIHSNCEWNSKVEAEKWAEEEWNSIYETRGRIIKETDNYYLIAGTTGDNAYSELVMILKGAVEKITGMREK